MENRTTLFENEDILVRKGNQLHEIMLLLIAFYGLVYSIIDFVLGHSDELYFILPIVPCVSIAYLLYVRGYKMASKIFNLVVVVCSIGGLCLVTSPKTFILSFFIPIFIGTLIVFQGRERKIGYIFTALTFLVFVFLLTTDYHIGNTLMEDEADIRREWYFNLIGAAAFSLLQVIFILRLSNTIQSRLLDSRTELFSANQRLKEAVDTRDKMISILSHDLRSPLVVLSSGLELLQPGRMAEEQRSPFIIELGTRVRQTLSMLDNLLLWSRRQADTVHFTPVRLPLSEIKTAIENYAHVLLSSKAIRFSLQVPGEGAVIADKDMLEAILRNLVSNAFKFTPVNGEVHLDILPTPSAFRFSIRDNGMGMSAEQVARLSGGISFTRVGTAMEKGHGIGMQLVRDFIERHSSRLEIVSEEASGTTFSFELKSA